MEKNQRSVDKTAETQGINRLFVQAQSQFILLTLTSYNNNI